MIIFLYGGDGFRSGERLIALKKEFFDKNKSNANSIVFDFEKGENLPLEKIKKDIFSPGLFSSKKMIILKNALNFSDKNFQEEICSILEKEDLSGDSEFVFWEKNDPKKNNKLFKILYGKGKTERFDKLSGNSLSEWIKERVEKRGAKINKEAVGKLIIFVGDDLLRVSNEIEKLVNFSPKKEITAEDIDLFVKSNIESNIFETVEALSSRDKNKALKLFREQLGNGDDPFYILSMYVYQFRNLLKIGSFYFKGINDKNIIAGRTKLHPFVIQKGLAQMRKFSFSDLKRIYRQLENLDNKVKTGEEKIEEALEKFIIKF